MLELSNNIYSYNKNNIILAPQISQKVSELSKLYLNASAKESVLDNIMLLNKKSKKGVSNYSKYIFPLNLIRKFKGSNIKKIIVKAKGVVGKKLTKDDFIKMLNNKIISHGVKSHSVKNYIEGYIKLKLKDNIYLNHNNYKKRIK